MKPREIAIAAAVGGMLVALLLGCGEEPKSDCRFAAETLCRDRPENEPFDMCVAMKIMKCGRPTQ